MTGNSTDHYLLKTLKNRYVMHVAQMRKLANPGIKSVGATLNICSASGSIQIIIMTQEAHRSIMEINIRNDHFSIITFYYSSTWIKVVPTGDLIPTGSVQVIDIFRSSKYLINLFNSSRTVSQTLLRRRTKTAMRRFSWCRREELNLRPWVYESHALTN